MIGVLVLLAVLAAALIAVIGYADVRAEERAELERTTRHRHPTHVRVIRRPDFFDQDADR